MKTCEEEVEFAAADHGMQNYAPLWRPLYLSGHAGDDGSLADSGIKHDRGGVRKCLSQGLFFGNYERSGQPAGLTREAFSLYLTQIVDFARYVHFG